MKNKMKLLRLIPLLGMWCAFSAQPAQAQEASVHAPVANDTVAPQNLIESITKDVLNAVKNDTSIQQGDIAKISALVDQKIIPYADLEKSTQNAVGRAWLKATVDQRQQLVEQFKKLLVYTYSGALAQIRNQKINILPLGKQAGGNEVIVRTQVVNPAAPEPMNVNYRLTKTAAGWKVWDVNIAGAWFTLTWRESFKGTLAQQDGINQLIKALKEQNERLASSNKRS